MVPCEVWATPRPAARPRAGGRIAELGFLIDAWRPRPYLYQPGIESRRFGILSPCATTFNFLILQRPCGRRCNPFQTAKRSSVATWRTLDFQPGYIPSFFLDVSYITTNKYLRKHVSKYNNFPAHLCHPHQNKRVFLGGWLTLPRLRFSNPILLSLWYFPLEFPAFPSLAALRPEQSHLSISHGAWKFHPHHLGPIEISLCEHHASTAERNHTIDILYPTTHINHLFPFEQCLFVLSRFE